MESSHHAKVLVGTYDACRHVLPQAEQAGADTDLYIVDHFSIEHARRLKEQAAQRPVVASKRTFIIACSRIESEAQNALLKLFEDPPQTAQFYLIVPTLSMLLPTLRSRLQVVEHQVNHTPSAHAADFLAANYTQRLAQIAKLHAVKDQHALRMLIEDVERTVSEKSNDMRTVRAVHVASRYRNARSASHKMLLEHLALALPAPYPR